MIQKRKSINLIEFFVKEEEEIEKKGVARFAWIERRLYTKEKKDEL